MVANRPKYYENKKLYIIDLISHNNCVDGTCPAHYIVTQAWGKQRQNCGSCGRRVRIMNSLPDHSQLSDANFMYGL
jgi:hypothetical protein